MAKEKSVTELRAEKQSLKEESSEMIAKMRKENRESNADEKNRFAEIEARQREINNEIISHEEENSKRGFVKKNQFSFRRALKNLAMRREQEDSEAELIEEATKLNQVNGFQRSVDSIVVPIESRSLFTAANEATIGVNIDEDQNEMLLPLQANLVLSKVGCRMMTGLVGNFYWPSYSGSTVYWEGENVTSQDGSGTFSKGTLVKPNRLTALAKFSNQLLAQENKSVESIVRNDLARQIAQKVESTAFSSAAHAENVPDGIFQTAPTLEGSLNWANIVAMETAVDVNNAAMGNLAYILHPSLLGKAKTTVKDASGAGGFVFQGNGDGMLNGYNAYRTTNIPSKLGTGTDEYGVVFGNWADFYLAQWGALEIKIDPYSGMAEDTVRFVINSYWNMGMIRPESFKTAAFK